MKKKKRWKNSQVSKQEKWTNNFLLNPKEVKKEKNIKQVGQVENKF